MCDLPLMAAHFFYYAGWPDKLDYAFPGRKVRPLGVAGQIVPWNFPLLWRPGSSRRGWPVETLVC
jgi:aldehyde dehydrogenase (NAD+)